jgi:methanogenic corrinoid protein MtbC1
VGHPLGNSDVVHEVGAHWYDVVGLSAGLTERIPKIADLIAAIRAGSLNADLAIMVGGRAFLHDPSLVDRVGADASAPDAAQGPLVARTLVQTRRTALDDQTPPSASLSP